MSEDLVLQVLAVAGTLLTVILGLMSDYLRRKTAIDIDEKHQRTLHRAIMSGLHYVMVRDRVTAADIASSPELRQSVKGYVARSSLDAVTRLGADAVLDELIIGKTAEAEISALPIALGSPPADLCDTSCRPDRPPLRRSREGGPRCPPPRTRGSKP